MRGLELAEQCWAEWGRLMVSQHFGPYEDRIAAGLVGEGSECFGFDDELSRDHDWASGFCMWLTEDDLALFGEDLQERYDVACREFCTPPSGVVDPNAGKRRGVFGVKAFYSRFIYYDHVPQTLAEWRSLPEAYLATATNGKVFSDPLGEFTAFREGLLAFYPEDVRLKKLAARCAAAAQAGQYNYGRCIARGELVAAHSALTAFAEAAMSITYLLNKRYRPFYKWMHRGVADLPVLGASCHGILADLFADTGAGGCQTATEAGSPADKATLIEELSAAIGQELVKEGLSESDGDFLMDHAYSVQDRIEDEELRCLHVMAE
jgi:hypothetical protein